MQAFQGRSDLSAGMLRGIASRLEDSDEAPYDWQQCRQLKVGPGLS